MKKKVLISFLVLVLVTAALLAYYVPEETCYHADGSRYFSAIFNVTITPFHFTDHLYYYWWFFDNRKPFILGASLILIIALLIYLIFRHSNILIAAIYISILDNMVNLFYGLFRYQTNLLISLTHLAWLLVTITVAYLLNPSTKPHQGEKLIVQVHFRIIHFCVDSFLLVITFSKLISLFELESFRNIFPFIGIENAVRSVYLFSFMTYYCFFEIVFGTTPGKIIFGHYVSNKEGRKPTKSTIVLRSICRLIPFDFASFIFQYDWHDKISKTRIIKPIKNVTRD